jgi:hypothetical protein
MTRQLVFVHGRSQQGKDAAAVKAEWLDALGEGLAKNGLSLPIAESDVRFPFYGDTLDQMTQGKGADDAADVIIKGVEDDDTHKRFMSAVLEEVRKRAGITEDELAEAAGQDVITKGPLNWEWLQAVVRAIDQHVPFGSGAAVALATNDVYQYLRNTAIRQEIDRGVAAAIRPDVETVVVAHSLGTVVAYNLLRLLGTDHHWKVPLFVTVGSPLAVGEIRKSVRSFASTRCPECAGAWFNAFDERDIVALRALDPPSFPLDPTEPAIHNKRDVKNRTTNRHGIAGYLDDPEVAKRIHAALSAP